MNKTILIGRLTKDPDIKYTQGEKATAIARYTLAVDRRHTSESSEQTADFIPCVGFGSNGEFAEKYLKKGIKIAVEGRIQTGSYTNKDGVKVYTTEVVVERQEFVESKNSGSAAAASAPAGDAAGNDGFVAADEDDEELPFN